MTTIEADPEVPTIRITREFEAPRERVFRAWVDPDLFVQWIGPRSLDTTIEQWDCRKGGSWRYVTGGVSGDEHVFFGFFHEVRETERLIQTFSWAGSPDGVSLETLTFDELPGRRTRVVALSVVESLPRRDLMLSSGIEIGLGEGFEKLDALLAQP